jgi:hypothetical protein
VRVDSVDSHQRAQQDVDDLVLPTRQRFVPVCMVIMPMTFDRVGVEAASEDEDPILVTSVQEAFDQFQPRLSFRGSAGRENMPIRIERSFRCLDDFEPERLRTHQPLNGRDSCSRNDLADLQDHMNRLRRLRNWWQTGPVREAWSDSEVRKRTISRLTQLRNDLQQAEASARAVGEALGGIPWVGHPNQSAVALLAQLDDPLQQEDTHEAGTSKIQAQISRVGQTCDDILEQVFEHVRPVERSYRDVALFFMNAGNAEDRGGTSAQLWILNCDASAMKDRYSAYALAATEHFLRHRNDNLKYQGQVSTLVVPGTVQRPIRERLEEVTERWGVVLVGHIGDEKTIDAIRQNCRAGQKYEFVKFAGDHSLQPVFTVGSLQLRPPHWFEHGVAVEDGLVGTPSLVLAGSLARIERESLPIGEVFLWPILGCDKSVPSFGVGDFDHYGIERQLLTPVRADRDRLCFYGCRPAADAPEGILRTFSIRRLVRFVRSSIGLLLMSLTGSLLTRDFIEVSIEGQLEMLLGSLQHQGVIRGHSLFVDKAREKRTQGILDIKLKLALEGVEQPVIVELSASGFGPEQDNSARFDS